MLRAARVVVSMVALAMATSRAESVQVNGRVIDPDGKPVIGAEVGTFWFADVDQPMRAFAGTKTDAKGAFTLECETNGRDQAVMAIAQDGGAGGTAVVDADDPRRPLVVRLGPLVDVRGHFTCRESGKPPIGTNLYLSLQPGQNRLIVNRSRGSEFALRLPPGEYELVGHGSLTDYEVTERAVTLKEGAHDLGAIDLKRTEMARHYGKELPPWHITDARGLPQGKGVTLADFRGKWVVLDFWGYWCHPCVAFSLPSWIGFAEEHDAHREKFVILAFHDPQAKSFAELDEKLAPVVKSSWHGKPLPFPTLLDSTGTTVERFGVSRFPTVLLVDPEGHLVDPEGVEVETYLAGELPPVPIERRIAHALARDIPFSTSAGMTLEKLVEVLGGVTRLKIELDEAELRAAGVSKDVQVPHHEGTLTLQGWLGLALKPFELTFIPGDVGLRIVRKTGS
jgi:thiol-disulfide isomerase/thioredoxin